MVSSLWGMVSLLWRMASSLLNRAWSYRKVPLHLSELLPSAGDDVAHHPHLRESC